MSGNCCDNSDLLDCIQEAADCIRACVADGFKSYDVYLIVASWSGSTVGKGMMSVTTELKFSPTPTIETFEGVSVVIEDGGRSEDGNVSLKFSNSLTEEIIAPQLKRNQEFYWEVRDKSTSKRRRLFPISSMAQSPVSTSRAIATRVMQAARDNSGIPTEQKVLFVPRAN